MYCMEKWEIYSHQKEFRQINSLVISLVKPLISRIFCQKCVRLNCSIFHSVVWKNDKFSLTKEIFRQINSLAISSVKPLLSRIVQFFHIVSVYCEFINFFSFNHRKTFIYSSGSISFGWHLHVPGMQHKQRIRKRVCEYDVWLHSMQSWDELLWGWHWILRQDIKKNWTNSKIASKREGLLFRKWECFVS